MSKTKSIMFSFGVHMYCCVAWGKSSVDIKYEDPKISKFYLNGYTRFSQEGRAFATVAAIYSRVVEAFQGELMEGSRLCRLYPDLWRVMT